MARLKRHVPAAKIIRMGKNNVWNVARGAGHPE